MLMINWHSIVWFIGGKEVLQQVWSNIMRIFLLTYCYFFPSIPRYGKIPIWNTVSDPGMTVTYMTIQIPFSTGRLSTGRTGIFWNFHLYFHSPIRWSLIVSFYHNSYRRFIYNEWEKEVREELRKYGIFVDDIPKLDNNLKQYGYNVEKFINRMQCGALNLLIIIPIFQEHKFALNTQNTNLH